MLAWALLLSAGLHLLAMVTIPNIRWEELKKPEVLQVELAPPQKAPEPAPAPEPEPQPEPEPPPPPKKEIPKPRIEPKPKVIPAPAPVAEAPPEPSKTEDVPPPAVITAPPEVEVPTFEAPPPPPPEPPKPTGPTQADLDAARSQYKSMLEREIIKHKQYPRVAKMRGWQGEAVIELQIDANGQPSSLKVQTSSGYEVLDNTAIEMVRKTVAATRLPTLLRGTMSTFLVPVSFRLQD
jgi:protein TonB